MEVSKRNELSYLLGLLQEECAEVIQEISKVQRFGVNEKLDQFTPENIKRVENEFKDVLCIARKLEDIYGFDFGILRTDLKHNAIKSAKLQRYAEYSVRLGLLEKD